MKTRALDSWAILEWISGRQPACDVVGRLLSEAEDGQTRLLMSAINVGEVYYFLHKNDSGALAESWRDSSATLPVTIEVPVMADIWSAAMIKSRFPLAYADAFAAAAGNIAKHLRRHIKLGLRAVDPTRILGEA